LASVEKLAIKMISALNSPLVFSDLLPMPRSFTSGDQPEAKSNLSLIYILPIFILDLP
jgi:hypothetical protein